MRVDGPNYNLKENLSAKYLDKLGAFCPGLKALSLKDCFIRGTNVKVSHLPKTIERLSMAGGGLY
jgi:hypothetical protein